MKKLFLTGLFVPLTFFVFSQQIDQVINAAEVEKLEKILSADAMQGRAAFTPSIDRAAAFIGDEFQSIGLQAPAKGNGYYQEFTLVRTRPLSVNIRLNQTSLPARDLAVFTSKENIHITQDSNYEKAWIRPGDHFSAEAFKYIQGEKNYLVLVDSSFSREMTWMSSMNRPSFKSDRTVVFVMSSLNPAHYDIDIKNEVSTYALKNVVGMLPGKSRPHEYVIFSGHYDHLGIGKPDAKGDSIYNGANDDASGTTAVIMLAKYFKKANNNERTLIFAAFTAEEEGGYGSQYFSRQFDPSQVVAMFNIEMIGTESRWGTNSAYITGYDKTDMGKILQQNLNGSKFVFYPDPYTPQQLFYRSDNATLARHGVPAHTISTSKMEEPPHDEPNYHKPSDEIGTLDMKNMAEIIKAIALSSASIVSGKDSPSRVDARALR